MAGTMDFEDSSLLEESKETLSPLKTGILDEKNVNDSLFSMSGEVSNTKEKSQSFLSEGTEERKSVDNAMTRLARKKTIVMDRTVPHITNLHEDQ